MKPPVGLMGNKRQKIWQLKQENKELRECLKALVDLYVVYKPEDNLEFITCMKPPFAADLTPLQRRRDKCWTLWDWARQLLGELPNL